MKEVRTTVKVSLGFVNAFRNNPQIKQDRKLNEKRKAHLKTELFAGRFRAPEWAVAVFNGVKYRINGNTTSSMFLDLYEENPNHPALAGMEVIMREFPCKSMNEVIDLWGTFDAPISSRKDGELIATVLGQIPDFDGCPAPIQRAIQTALGLRALGMNQRSKDRNTRKDLLRTADAITLWKFIQRLNEWSSGAAQKVVAKLMRASVMAVMIETVIAYEETAFAFWTELAKGNGEPECATRTVRDFLLTTAARGGSTTRGVSASDKEFICRLWLAWETWNKDATLEFPEYPDDGDGSFADDEKNIMLPPWVSGSKA